MSCAAKLKGRDMKLKLTLFAIVLAVLVGCGDDDVDIAAMLPPIIDIP